MNKGILSVMSAGMAMLILILDTKTALCGAAEGMELCIRTVIPTLFPFIFLSIILTGSISGHRIPLLKPVCRFLNIPQGTETLWIIGLLGGYPVGAQCTAQAVRNGDISRETGRRMLAFCSNAGPAFLFGIGSKLFSQMWKCWALWAIHIASSLIIGHVIPAKQEQHEAPFTHSKQQAPQTMQQALRVMATICGWVMLFRILLLFCRRWFLWRLPLWGQCLFAGLLELTNGCCGLAEIGNEDLRFVLCALFLGFGGLCVTMQTYSVCEGTDPSRYLPGKIGQAVISTLLALAVISQEMAWSLCCLFAFLLPPFHIYRRNRKNKIAFFPSMMYNGRKINRR